MQELLQILAAVQQWQLQQQGGAALATVVQVAGSAYRRPGARMLVAPDGSMTGAISGGCLEGDALRKAQLTMQQQQRKLVTYDTTDEDDALVGAQLGCAGVIQVLFEPLPACQQVLSLLQQATGRRQRSVLLAIYPTQPGIIPPGTCACLSTDGSFAQHLPEGWPLADLRRQMEQVLASGVTSFGSLELQGQSWQLCFEVVQPPIQVLLVGAGNDAIPLVAIGQQLGWHMTVADGRSSHARPQRFAAGCQVFTARPADVLQHWQPDDRSAVVLMTHNYQYDKAMLRELLPMALPYLGVLGPRKKLDRILQELQDEGLQWTDDMLLKVHGPTGLEIGAETPAEIALSIAAEIQACSTGHSGGKLRQKNGPIHAAAVQLPPQ